jgi:hypothetical protein
MTATLLVAHLHSRIDVDGLRRRQQSNKSRGCAHIQRVNDDTASVVHAGITCFGIRDKPTNRNQLAGQHAIQQGPKEPAAPNNRGFIGINELRMLVVVVRFKPAARLERQQLQTRLNEAPNLLDLVAREDSPRLGWLSGCVGPVWQSSLHITGQKRCCSVVVHESRYGAHGSVATTVEPDVSADLCVTNEVEDTHTKLHTVAEIERDASQNAFLELCRQP